MRVTPVMGALAVLAIIFLMSDPPRGKADGSHLQPTSPVNDIKVCKDVGLRILKIATVWLETIW